MPSVYEIITDRIVKALENGAAPWRKPWKGHELAPRNAISKKPYRGINAWLTRCSGYANPNWLTFKQAQEVGGSVKKGEKGLPVVFWKIGERLNSETGKKEKTFLLRYYTVFNVEQCEGLAEKFPTPEIPGTKTPSPPLKPVRPSWAICRLTIRP